MSNPTGQATVLGVVAFAIIGVIAAGCGAVSDTSQPRSVVSATPQNIYVYVTPSPTATVAAKKRVPTPSPAPSIEPVEAEIQTDIEADVEPVQSLPERAERSPYIPGPRGGCYYINRNGNKTYVDRSLCAGNEATRPAYLTPSTPARSSSTSSSGGYIRGPRGGCYYINSRGNKTYVDRSLCS